MADADMGREGGGEAGGDGSWAAPGQSSSAVRVVPLGPEQVRRVLEQVAKAQPLAEPSPPFVLQDAARRLRDAAQQAALQRAPGAESPRPPRLLPPQQLETICVKVTAGDTKGLERPMPPLATIQPKMGQRGQPPGRTCSLAGFPVASPQLFRVQTLRKAGLPQPPAPQVSAQRPLPALQPVPAKRLQAACAPNGQVATLTPLAVTGPPAITAPTAGSVHLFASPFHSTHAEKPKKLTKVKTRSGRISRPPRYKVKDYKFIKREDLADGHPSDSDDYSDLSMEEEEEKREARALFDSDSASWALRPKTFRCQACEKSYIGKGGLARHFKLNPDHGQLEPEMLPTPKEVNGSLRPDCVEARTRGLTTPDPSMPAASLEDTAESARAGLQSGQAVVVEEARVPEPDSGSYSALLGSEGRLSPRSGDSEASAEFSMAVLPQSQARPGAARRRASLEECLQQCGREELVELVLPQLAQVVTLYEFLVKKVETGPLAKPFFPAVYREFEELHNLVKKLCADYLSSSRPCPREPLEINNRQVAESLGITEGLLRKKEIHSECLAPKRPILETDRHRPEEASREQGGTESTREVLAAAKRPRREAVPLDGPVSPAAHSGGCEKLRLLCAPPASEASGSTPPHSEESHGARICDSDGSVSRSGQRLVVSADLASRSESVGHAVPHGAVSWPALYAQLEEPAGLTPAQVAASPEESAPERSACQDTRSGQRRPDVWGALSSAEGGEHPLPGGSQEAEARNIPTWPGCHLHHQQASSGHVLLTQPVVPSVEKILPMDIVPVDCASRTASEPRPQPGPGGLSSITQSFRSQARDLNPLSQGMEVQAGQRELESAAGIGEVSSRCQEVLAQGQEQIDLQTSDGLVLSHPGTIMSQEEHIVIVTDAEGSALHISPPEDIILGTVESVLTMEAEPAP
ncbi:zinc finger protein 839 [Ctenodactylus gundi]